MGNRSDDYADGSGGSASDGHDGDSDSGRDGGNLKFIF